MQQPGYLFLETHPDNPELIRLGNSLENPLDAKREGNAKLRYVVQFFDIEAAAMHAHSAMRRKLKDINHHLYRVSLGEAVADINTIQLRKELVWSDPAINVELDEEIARTTERNRATQRRYELFAKTLAVGALILLLFNFISPLLSELLS